MHKKSSIVPELLAIISVLLLCATLFFVGIVVGANKENAEREEFANSLRPVVPGCLI